MSELNAPHTLQERQRFRLAAQIALLGSIGGQILAVSVDYRNKVLHMYFYAEGILAEEEKEDLEVAGTELYAYFGTDAKSVEVHIIENVESPFQGDDGFLVFLRRGAHTRKIPGSP
jgi:hypothetical protein